MRLQGKIALVTGASSGIGAATAKLLAQRGARVALVARTESALREVAAEIAGAGGEARVYVADLGDAAQAEKAVRAVESEMGAPDLLVNNAGAGKWRFVEETAPEDVLADMAAPYFAAFFTTRAALPGMLKRGSGRIVNVTSPASRIAWPGAASYVAARFALRGFNNALRGDLRGSGVSVTLATLAVVKSAYFDHNPGSYERLPRIARLIPTLTNEEAAAAIVYAVERDRREMFAPFVLRLFHWLWSLAPGLVEWLAEATGYRRGQAQQ
jgi:short-subunit dehydrogenase